MRGRILLVDDNEEYLDSAKDVLEEEGYSVATASSGEKAVRRILAQNFDVVLMDIKMAGLNGVEALVEMKKHRPSLRVVMCTAHILESMIAMALREGAFAILKKPFKPDELLDTIDSAMCS
ncbi:MAG: response regulator [Thermodesulfobacteriota bacterium]